jgi:hypothetical protein
MSNARDTLVAFYLQSTGISFCQTFRDIAKWLSEQYPNGEFDGQQGYNDGFDFKVDIERNGKRYFVMFDMVDLERDNAVDFRIQRAVLLNGRKSITLRNEYLLYREVETSSSVIKSLELFDKLLEMKFQHQELANMPGIIQMGV